MNVHTQTNQQNSYDVIIVGSGISGGWAAKELCEKGLKVLLLERGKSIEHPTYETATKDPWDFTHRNQLTNNDKDIKHIQARHYSFKEDNKHYYINDKENPYTEIKRYDWIRGDILGGRSILWGRHCYRWSDLDFEANMRDGVAVDWPIRYKDLAPWYDYVETFIGVSGQAENIPHLPDGKFQPPMEFNCVEKQFKQVIEKKFPERKIIMGRVANLTQTVKGRGKCQHRNLCHRGCPYGAYFSTNSSTLPAAIATGNLTVKTDMLVNRVLYDEEKKRATGIEALNVQTQLPEAYYARVIFLNASTLATTFILLNSTSKRFPQGLGNGSGQIGHNLMDHHKGTGASAFVEGFEDEYYFGHRPNTTYIPRFRNLHKQEMQYTRGFVYMGSASRASWGAFLRRPELGSSLKEAVQTPGPWKINFTGYGECLPYYENKVTLDHNKKDKFGRPTLVIDCEFKENEKKMSVDMAEEMGKMLETAGYRDIEVRKDISFPGNANHEMGTARMGRDPKTSVLNGFNQLHEVPNVFITDGSCMTSSSCVNPSLTYMALTVRACNYAVEQMKRQNL